MSNSISKDDLFKVSELLNFIQVEENMFHELIADE